MAGAILPAFRHPAGGRALITREPEFPPPPLNLYASFGRRILLNLRGLGRAVLMFTEAFWLLRHMLSRRNREETLHQLHLTGIRSLGVITIVAMFTGMILALQTGLELRRFGLQANIGTAVAVTMLREMGPFMTALIIAASVGSAIAAQVGTMVVQEEVSALEVMSINPVRFIVMPRLAALAIMMPLLTLYTNVLGIVGGAVVGATQLGVSFQAYFDNAQLFAVNKDMYVGLFKAVVFGVVIATTACHQGFQATEGAVGVGQATRRTVVIAFLTILVLGYMITRMFYL